MTGELIQRLVGIGFSEYEAKAYVALLKENPVTGYQLSKSSGVPRSMIYEVAGKLLNRGAVMTLHEAGSTKYAPVPATLLLDQIQREHDRLVTSLKQDLSSLTTMPDPEYVWNIEGHANVIGRAVEMIKQAQEKVYAAILPDTYPELRAVMEEAVSREVKVTIYTTGDLELPGGRVAVARSSRETLSQARGLGLVLVVDGNSMLIAEWLSDVEARASWTSSPLLVFIAEHHLRTDLYLPQILTLLGDKALDIIQEEDRALFARAFESHL